MEKKKKRKKERKKERKEKKRKEKKKITIFQAKDDITKVFSGLSNGQWWNSGLINHPVNSTSFQVLEN